MTVIQNMMSNITRGLEALPPECFHFLLQEALLVVAPMIVCGLLFENDIRIVPLQVSLLIITVLAVITIPIDRLNLASGMTRLYTSVLSLLSVIFGSPRLCRYVVSTPIQQAILLRCIYVEFGILMLAQIAESYLK